MLVPNRHGSSNSYRYGFQGQEKDDEIKGEGNSLNYTFRMHDARVGRFFAIDPLTHKYPFYSPYQFSGNKVIQFVELEGLEEGPSGSKSALNFTPDSGKLNLGGQSLYDIINEIANMPLIKGNNVEVIGTKKEGYSGWSAEFSIWDPIDQSNTPKKTPSNTGSKNGTVKVESRVDRMKRLSKDKWTKEQVDAFSANFDAGWSNTSGYGDEMAGFLAVGLAPILAGEMAPYVLSQSSFTSMGVKAGISGFAQYQISGSVNLVGAASDGIFTTGFGSVTGAAFEANIDFKTKSFNTKSIFGSGIHAKSINDFTIEVSTSYIFGSKNGYFGKVANSLEVSDAAKSITKGIFETSSQLGNYGAQKGLKD